MSASIPGAYDRRVVEPTSPGPQGHAQDSESAPGTDDGEYLVVEGATEAAPVLYAVPMEPGSRVAARQY